MCGCTDTVIRFRWANPTTGKVTEFKTRQQAERAVKQYGGNYQAVQRAKVST